MRILISGASGFIGKALKASLEAQGCQAVPLVRFKAIEGHSPEEAVLWDPSSAQFSAEDFEGFDAVIHLAGENIVSGRWTRARKQALFLSRCRDTWVLSQILSRLKQPPKAMLCASAVGIYGDRGEGTLDETSTPGTGFFPDLCSRWEMATHVLTSQEIRVVHMRFGAVLSPEGGVLQKLLPLYRWGLGGRLGSGKQYLSWIALQDVLGAVFHCLSSEDLRGPVNFTSPYPARQKEFAKALSTRLGRPLLFPLPGPLLKILFGEMAQEVLLASARVEPKALVTSGYTFAFPDLLSALSSMRLGGR